MKVRIAAKRNETSDNSQFFNDYETVYVSEKIVEEISMRFDDGEVENIIIDSSICHVEAGMIDALLTTLIKKLRIGCSMFITGTDIRAVCSDYYNMKMSLDELNGLIFGSGEKCAMSLEGIVQKLSNNEKAQIQGRVINSQLYSVEVSRI